MKTFIFLLITQFWLLKKKEMEWEYQFYIQKDIFPYRVYDMLMREKLFLKHLCQ